MDRKNFLNRASRFLPAAALAACMVFGACPQAVYAESPEDLTVEFPQDLEAELPEETEAAASNRSSKQSQSSSQNYSSSAAGSSSNNSAKQSQASNKASSNAQAQTGASPAAAASIEETEAETEGAVVTADAGEDTLAEPEMLSAEVISNGVTITWAAVDGAEEYGIYRQLAGEDTWTRVGKTAETSYTSYGVESGNSYLFTVRAEAGSVYSEYGNSTVSVSYLKEPAMSSISNGDGYIYVTWSEVEDVNISPRSVQMYGVYYRTSESGDWTYLESVAGTGYTFENVVSGTTYQFTVSAERDSGNSAYGSSVKTILYLDEPVMADAVLNASSVTITWDPVDGAEEYGVYRKLAGESTWTRVGKTAETTYTSSGVTSGNDYLFTVRAESGSYYSAYGYSTVSVSYVKMPTMKSAANNNGSITVTWSAVDNADSYDVYYKTSDEDAWAYAGNTADASYEFTEVTSGVTYQFTVCAKTGDTESVYGSSFKSITYLDEPEMLSAAELATGVTITWEAVDGAEEYGIYRRAEGDEEWTRVGKTADTSYSSYGVTSGNGYEFTVRAESSGGNSVYGESIVDIFFGKSYNLPDGKTFCDYVSDAVSITFGAYGDYADAVDGIEGTMIGLTDHDAVYLYADGTAYYVLADDTIHFNADSSYMFAGISSLKSISFSNIDTSDVTNMGNMFNGCSGLTILDLTAFDTSSVTDMRYMFAYCSRLTSIDMGGWDTSSLKNMYTMFYCCTGLTSLDVSGFDTSNVTDIENLFRGCANLASLDLSTWDTSKVTTMNQMFGSCSSLTELDLSTFNTSSVQNMSYMFAYCSSLKSIDMTGWNTSRVSNMSYMFEYCYALTSLDFSSFNTSKVTDMSRMFWYCTGLNELDLSMFDTVKVTSMSYMFTYCTSLEKITVSANWKLAADLPSAATGYAWLDEDDNSCTAIAAGLATAMTYKLTKADMAFAVYSADDGSLTFYYGQTPSAKDTYNGKTVTKVYSGFDSKTYTSYSSVPWYSYRTSIKSVVVEDAISPSSTAYWFYGMTNCTSMDLSSLDTSNVTSMAYMFRNCSKLAELDLSGWDTSCVKNMAYMFSGCSGLAELDLSGFDTVKVTDMSNLFYNCTGLVSVDMGGLDTSGVKNMGYMFQNCSSLENLDVSGWDTSSVTAMYYMFYNCPGLTELDLSSFDTAGVTNMNSMFYGCTSLATVYAGDGWSTGNVTSSTNMFKNCTAIVGGAGTVYDSGDLTCTYARIDAGVEDPGYFTYKAA